MNKHQQKIVDSILEQLNQGTVPWKRPWFAIGKCNLVTGHVYKGANRMLLANKQDQYYLTYNQAKKLGGYVLSGEKASLVFFWKITNFKKDDTEDGEFETKFYCQSYNVFGISQVWLPPETQDKLLAKREITLKSNALNTDVESFIENIDPEIVNDDLTRAFYSPMADFINMPNIGQFDNSDKYYSTLLHELVHWTGHKSRLDRNLTTSFSDGGYGKEELVAEIGNTFLCHEFKIDDMEQSSSYINSWVKAINEKPNIIFSAATQADKAVEYLKNI